MGDLRLLREEMGTSLVELIAGMAVAALILGVVVNMLMQSWRYEAADRDRFAKESQSALALDHFVLDARRATGPAAVTPGASTITLDIAGSPVTYSFNPSGGEVIRTAGGVSRVVGRGIGTIAYYPESGGRTVRAELSALRLTGSEHKLTVRATLRN